MTKFISLLEDFEKALHRLAEVLQEEKTDIVRDSAIKRFELVFDLGWKTMKAFLEEEHNVSCFSPRACFREAFRAHILDYDEFWINVTALRNYTVHAYSEIFAEKIYRKLPEALKKYRKLLLDIKNIAENEK